LLHRAGHEVFTPTLSGLGERSHLLHPGIDLDAHIEDVAQVLRFERLERVILVGHSYGGMVVTGVAERSPDRIGHLVYLDAVVPEDGRSLLDLRPPAESARLRDITEREGAGWRIPPSA